MDATSGPTETPQAGEPPRPDERARARLYLDLWERHLSHLAVYGSPPAGVRPPK